jgi:hypothetical protein
MIIADLSLIEGRRYPARRLTQNLVGGASPLRAKDFCMGHVTLDPRGGQVPWHNHEQEEIYFIVEGTSHHTNLFTVLVGSTARGRKGTSEGRVRQILRAQALHRQPRLRRGCHHRHHE